MSDVTLRKELREGTESGNMSKIETELQQEVVVT